jgi:hypothetical protein
MTFRRASNAANSRAGPGTCRSCRRMTPVHVSPFALSRTSSASTPRLPDGANGTPPLAKPENSPFPHKELPHMPGSQTTPGWAGACDGAPAHVALLPPSHSALPEKRILPGSTAPAKNPGPGRLADKFARTGKPTTSCYRRKGGTCECYDCGLSWLDPTPLGGVYDKPVEDGV